MANKIPSSDQKLIDEFLKGKSEITLTLFNHFVKEYKKIGDIGLVPTKIMIAIATLATPSNRIAWITQLGKSFIHVVFPFKIPYSDNLCFQKIAQVPGDDHQFNHHFRMLLKEDLNDEVKNFMKIAYLGI